MDNLLRNIFCLPNELMDIIYSYIPISITLLLTKDNYIKNHKILKKYIDKFEIENYIRSMIRQDYDLVFQNLLVENNKKWLKMKNYLYKNSIYSNYLIFLEYYCIENQSTKCRKLMNELFEKLGLSKNQHKKNRVRYIRWK